MAQKKVLIYTTPTCPFCHQAKDYLTEKKIAFTNYDVTSDNAKAQEMIDKSGQMGVPVLDIEGKIIVGFDKPAIDKELEIK
ncbi:MAG: glutaredoxin domain-containing protein [Patescibacteria group bacterium]|nr:glutaredoxin domain-containing protein [Patescibacteria group bacterium]